MEATVGTVAFQQATPRAPGEDGLGAQRIEIAVSGQSLELRPGGRARRFRERAQDRFGLGVIHRLRTEVGVWVRVSVSVTLRCSRSSVGALRPAVRLRPPSLL